MTLSVAPMPTLMIVPTGIGCQVGGFAGDALPSARLLAAASGCLITHPNVINGASLYWRDSRIHYVEGYGLDRFASSAWGLRPKRNQRIGLLLDAGIESDLRIRHRQVAEGCRASLGLDINAVVTTDAPLVVHLCAAGSGTSWGTLDRPDALLRAGERLKAAGSTAIAVVARFPDEFTSEVLTAYRHGRGVDGLAGAEAVISHLLVRHLQIPCAHAPALAPLPLDADLDPRAAGEELGHTFLACVLVGLSRAPDLLDLSAGSASMPGDLVADQLGALVVPDGALGGEAVFACLERNVPVIAVLNPGVLSVSAEALGVGHQVLKAASYLEAAGLLVALREGIAIPSLGRPFPALRELN
ncbi:DUF3326 domain-containing protein [Synechococcus sp. MIT S9507]|uniref:DUF3326 domain-containing protein n=1 Tax=Synechococcus sp. MIT S9507 TaxID=3082544 RepID=UPI0039B5530A